MLSQGALSKVSDMPTSNDNEKVNSKPGLNKEKQRKRRKALSDSNWTRTHDHLVHNEHSNIWPVWLNGWVFVYELSGCGFESSCCHLNF